MSFILFPLKAKSQPDETADNSSQVTTAAVPESSSNSSVKSKDSNTSVKPNSGSQTSQEAQVNNFMA